MAAFLPQEIQWLRLWCIFQKTARAPGRSFTSPVLTVAKARGLFKAGWQVHVVDANGRVFHPDKFDHLLRFDPPKPTIKF